MKYFEKLIERIDSIEDEFNIINSRIIEFWKSTDYKYIDFWLVSRYYDVLNKYINFLKFELELLENNDNENIEFQSEKKLINIRILSLIDKINNILSKVKNIINIKQVELDNKKVDKIFNSSNQMENIERLLDEFNWELKIYKKIQKDLWFRIDLNDDIEKNIEKEKTREDMIFIQRNFIEDVSDFLWEILKNKESRINELNSREDILFKSILNNNLYDISFKNIFKTNYIVWLRLEWAWLYKDNLKFENFNDNIDLLLDIWTFCNDFEYTLANSRVYWLEKIILSFSDIKKLLEKEVLNIKISNIDDFIFKINNSFWIYKLKKLFKLFDLFWDLIENYKALEAIDFDTINDYYEDGFVSFLKTKEVWDNIISNLIEFSVKSIIKDFNNLDITFSSFEKSNILEILEENISIMDKLYLSIKNIHNYILRYNYPTSYLEIRKKILTILEFYRWYKFYYDLVQYYTNAIKHKARVQKSNYYSRRRWTRWRVSYWWWGYSSWWWGWSSWSSSWWSSYSSSWGSSW